MSLYGLAPIFGVGIVLLFGIYGGLYSASGGLDVVVVLNILNTAMIFVIMTLAYEYSQRHP